MYRFPNLKPPGLAARDFKKNAYEKKTTYARKRQKKFVSTKKLPGVKIVITLLL